MLGCVCALFATSCKKSLGPRPLGKTATSRAQGCELDASLEADGPGFVVGAEAYVTFRVRTDCARELTVASYNDRESRFGRPDSYQVSAMAVPGGEAVETLAGGENFGGGMGRIAFTRDNPVEVQLALSHWLVFSKPGRYEVIVDKSLDVGGATARDEHVGFRVSTFVDVSAPAR